MSARASSNFVALGRSRRGLLWWLGVCVQIAFWSLAPSALAQTAQAPAISNVEIVNPDVARYEKLEIAFDVETSATQLNLPFDENPPPGLRAGEGISVDALFSNDNFQTTITQPAFFYQPFVNQPVNTRDHLISDGAPSWRVRFAPRAAGDWQVKLRARDRGGETIYPAQAALTFTVHETTDGRYGGLRENPYTQHGFLRVSKDDPRYFGFEDGAPFPGIGYFPAIDSVAEANARFRQWQLNGLKFARLWLSGAGINASQWTPWTFPSQPFTNSLPALSVDGQTHLPNADFSFRLNKEIPCLFVDFWQNGIPVQPNTTYTISARVKLTDVTTRADAQNAGFSIFRDGWIGAECSKLDAEPLLPFRAGSTDWETVTFEYTTTPTQNFLDYLYFALRDVEQGQVNFDDVQVFAKDDPKRVNLLRHGRADSHLNFDAMNAAKWDLILQEAEQHGVFLKIVIDEKNEWIRNSIQKDGALGKWDNNNFYAAPKTKVRWLQETWWRYIIARWGYSTAIHSFEYVNEGDPYNGNHYNAAEAMARYFDENDPSQHMTTTSFWHSFPNKEFWSNPKYSAIDYADLHAYITTGWGANASFVPPAYLETRPQFQFQGNNSFHIPAKQTLRQQIHPRGVTLQEKGEWTIRYWMKQEKLRANCGGGKKGSNARVFWELDNGQKGVVPSNAQGQNSNCASPDGTFDWREFSSQTDRDGRALPMTKRLVISDDLPHALTLGISNSDGIAGDTWIAQVELISPSGIRTPIIGEFDNTPFEEDTAWLTAAYSELWGGASPVGAHKPLVRGETGVNNAQNPNGLAQLNQDREGVWLHNFLWGQINAGGMYDLWWWGEQNIEDYPKSGRTGNLFNVFLPYANFMLDIPINNGTYRDANALTSSPQLRAWGQRDDTNGRAHLWIQNRAHQWQALVANAAIAPIEGTVTLENMPPGTYRIEWWDTYKTRDPIFKTESVPVENTLKLQLPEPLLSDVAVKIERIAQ